VCLALYRCPPSLEFEKVCLPPKVTQFGAIDGVQCVFNILVLHEFMNWCIAPVLSCLIFVGVMAYIFYLSK